LMTSAVPRGLGSDVRPACGLARAGLGAGSLRDMVVSPRRQAAVGCVGSKGEKQSRYEHQKPADSLAEDVDGPRPVLPRKGPKNSQDKGDRPTPLRPRLRRTSTLHAGSRYRRPGSVNRFIRDRTSVDKGDHPPSPGLVLSVLGIPRCHQRLLAKDANDGAGHHQCTAQGSAP
jgi:hypothetical protein